MLEFGAVAAPPADLIRLLALPAFAWAAWSDVRTRRVSNRLWPPLVAIAAAALIVDGVAAFGGPFWWGFVLTTLLSVGLIVPLAYAFWYVGGFGGADAKALMTIAVLFPAFPTYIVADYILPVSAPAHGLFALSILTNAVLLGLVYPVALAGRNGLEGKIHPIMFVGRQVPVESLRSRPGRLLESPEGIGRRGLDLDALRMYLSWRRTTLDELRADPAGFRETLPTNPADPGDGSIADGGTIDDPWGAEAFLDAADGAYGTTPAELREGLSLVANRDRLWYSPGIPFVVFLVGGILLGMIYGDLFAPVLRAVGLG